MEKLENIARVNWVSLDTPIGLPLFMLFDKSGIRHRTVNG